MDTSSIQVTVDELVSRLSKVTVNGSVLFKILMPEGNPQQTSVWLNPLANNRTYLSDQVLETTCTELKQLLSAIDVQVPLYLQAEELISQLQTTLSSTPLVGQAARLKFVVDKVAFEIAVLPVLRRVAEQLQAALMREQIARANEDLVTQLREEVETVKRNAAQEIIAALIDLKAKFSLFLEQCSLILPDNKALVIMGFRTKFNGDPAALEAAVEELRKQHAVVWATPGSSDK